jgi:uncharacterized protein
MTWRLLAAVCLLGSMGCAAAPVDGPTGTVFDAIRAGQLPRLQQIISAQPEVLTERNAQGATALMFAAYLERAELVGALRAAKKELDFFEACIAGDLPLLRAHLARGQEVNLRSPDGFTPLGLAIFFGRPDAARLLLDAGADVNTASSNALRVAPVHAAVARSDLATLSTLLLRGADPNRPQQQLLRPLHEAAAANNLPAVAMLLMFGADITARSEEGKSAADLARLRGHRDLAQRLEFVAGGSRR